MFKISKMQRDTEYLIMTSLTLPKNHTGFTLLEVIIILIIMGTLFSLMSLSISTKPSAAKKTATHLQQLLEFAHDDAMLKGQILAWKLKETKHSFYRYQNQNWLLIENDRILYEYPLSEEVDYELQINDFFTENTDSSLPQVMLLPDGSLTDFNLILQLKETGERYRVFNRQDKVAMERMESDF